MKILNFFCFSTFLGAFFLSAITTVVPLNALFIGFSSETSPKPSATPGPTAKPCPPYASTQDFMSQATAKLQALLDDANHGVNTPTKVCYTSLPFTTCKTVYPFQGKNYDSKDALNTAYLALVNQTNTDLQHIVDNCGWTNNTNSIQLPISLRFSY